jgi:hypothetical protein
MGQFAASERSAAPAKDLSRWGILLLLSIAIILIFILRTKLAVTGSPPRLFEIFEILTLAGSLAVLAAGWRKLERADWLVGVGVGVFIAAELQFSSIFSPYPYFDLITDLRLLGLLRGLSAGVACLGGLVIMRWGGPVQVRLARGEWRRALVGLAIGAAIGLPLAVLNLYANSWTQGRPFVWQNPLAAALDALQPALFEEVIYRLALLGLLWLALRKTWPGRAAAWLAGGLAMLVHSFSHMSDLFVTQPLLALGMGAAMALLWGLPELILALRRDLESAVGFHWIQDAARFFGGL